MSELHSDEWSTDDAFLADEEKKNKQKPVGMCYGPTRPVRNGLKDRSLRSSVWKLGTGFRSVLLVS